MTQEKADASPSGNDRHRWVLLGGVWLLYFCFGMIVASMAPLIPVISAELGIGNSGMGAILGAWPLVYIVSAIPCGMALDRLKPRISLALAGAIIGLSALARGMAHDEWAMFLAVALFGVGGPMISVGAPKLVAQWFAESSRGIATGIYMTGPALGNATALAVTNSVLMPLTGNDWRTVMMLYAAFAFAGALAWLAIAGGERGAAVPTSAAERGFALPAIVEIVRLPSVQLLLVMAVGVFFVNHGINNWLPEILRSKGLDATAAGYWASLPTMIGIASALIIPRFAIPARRMAIVFALFASMLIANALLAADFGAPMIGALLLLGVVRGSVVAVVMLLLMETPAIPRHRLGLAGGMFFVAAETGGVLGPVTLGTLSQWTGDFGTSILALGVVSILLLLCAGLFSRVRRAPAR